MINNFTFNAQTDLYCIFGNPVIQSKSPVMHNTVFMQNRINAVYLAFNIDHIETGVKIIRELGIKGASITIPFKKKIIEHLDIIDDNAEKIGAVNTIVNKNGKLKGYNTDWYGGIKPLEQYSIKDKKIGIIGAGGAAHALAFGIKKSGGNLSIINRSNKNGEKLAEKYDCTFLNLTELKNKTFDIIINATPVGMTPGIENSPVKKECLHPGMIIMDIVYNPIETKLIRQARKIGCTTIDGLSMFVSQGAEQFKLWTGINPSIKLMKNTVIKELLK